MNNTELVQFIKKFDSGNSAYWYGCFGQIATKSLYESKRGQYKSQYTVDREARYMDDISKSKYVLDCSGLIKSYTMRNGYDSKYDLSANMMIKKSTKTGSIDTIPEIAGLGLWKNNHVAVYLGNGTYKEAASFASGIRIDNQLSKFTSWFYIPDIDYSGITPIDTVPADDLISKLAHDCIKGIYGNYPERKHRINALGYGNIYIAVQRRVNDILAGKC